MPVPLLEMDPPVPSTKALPFVPAVTPLKGTAAAAPPQAASVMFPVPVASLQSKFPDVPEFTPEMANLVPLPTLKADGTAAGITAGMIPDPQSAAAVITMYQDALSHFM